MAKIIYFLAGEAPTSGELADIAQLNAAAVAPYSIAVRRGDDVASYSFGAGIEAADYVAGTVPAAYSDEEDFPVFDPDNVPPVVNDGDEIDVVNSAGDVTKTGSIALTAGEASVELPATVAMVTTGVLTGITATGSGTTVTLTVTAGKVSAVTLS